MTGEYSMRSCTSSCVVPEWGSVSNEGLWKDYQPSLTNSMTMEPSRLMWLTAGSGGPLPTGRLSLHYTTGLFPVSTMETLGPQEHGFAHLVGVQVDPNH